MPRTALVTGAAGFLGGHLAGALATVYDRVDGLDLRPAAGPGVRTSYVGDARDLLPELPRYDAVFHLAALVGGRAGIEDRPLGVAGNLATDVAFFDYVVRVRPAHAAYLSSSAVYPATCPAAGERHTEDSVRPQAPSFDRPDGLYGWVKLTGEQLAHSVRERFGVPVLCYRPFTVYGPGQTDDYPVAAVAARVLAGEDPLRLWGSGRQVRDFVYVGDAVAAILATHREGLTALNVCTGVGTDFRSLAELAAGLTGYHPRILGDTDKPAGVQRRVGCPDRLATWYRTQVPLAAGLRAVLAHHT
jgi:UDP-glucose 4-epimerase